MARRPTSLPEEMGFRMEQQAMETLEEELAEVKCLYHDKFGTDVDEIDESQLQRCQDSLCELQALPAQLYRHDIDDVDEYGCVWVKTACSSCTEWRC